MSKSFLVKLNASEIDALIGEDLVKRIDRATEVLIPIIAEDLHPYLPYKTGKLDKSTKAIPKEHLIHISAEYAGYALYPLTPKGLPKEYNKKVHPKASGTPVSDAEKELKDKWLRLFEEEVRKDV